MASHDDQIGDAITMEKLLFRVPEVVRSTGISRTGVYDLIAAGALPARKLGRVTLVEAEGVKTFIEGLPRVEPRSSKA